MERSSRIFWVIALFLISSCLTSCGSEQISSSPRARSPKPGKLGGEGKNPAGGKNGSKGGESEGSDQDDQNDGDGGDANDEANDESNDDSSGGAKGGAGAKDGGADDDNQDEQGENSAGPVVFPKFSFSARGISSCKGDDYETTTRMSTLVDESTLTIDTTAAHIKCDGSCEKRANEDLQKDAVGATRYTRVSADVAKEIGASYAIFATSATKKDGTVVRFDPYLPVFPFPAPKARYEALKNSPKSWTATVTVGDKTFRMKSELTLVRTSDSEIEVLISNIILDVTAPAPILVERQTAELYELLPMPKTATYKIDPKSRNVTAFDTDHSWLGNDNCASRVEHTALKYSLCQRDKGGVVETFPCPP